MEEPENKCPKCGVIVTSNNGLCANCLEEVLSKSKEPQLNVEGAEVTLTGVYALFYILVRQSQQLKPGSKMAFDLNAFKTLPKKVAINFERKEGKLLVWIPEKPSDHKKKSKLYLPEHKIVTVN